MTYCPTCGHFHGAGHWHTGHRHHQGYYGPYYQRVIAPGVRSDEDIRRDVQDALFWDTWVDSTKVDVDVKGGVVTLTGTVDSPTEKRAAGDDAWDIPGVMDVNNNLQIRAGGEAPHR